MKLRLIDAEQNSFALTGECPHCRAVSAFHKVTSAYREVVKYERASVCAGMQCPGCGGYILGVLDVKGSTWSYRTHYPVGAPGKAAEEIPEAIRTDFEEALRCRSVDAYNATVEMCRRAIESSCIQLGADPGNVIKTQIDWVADQGLITSPLREMAHSIRLGGNRGAHPPGDLTEAITEEDAEAVLEFTKHYFQHVYVMRTEIAKYDFSKSASAGKKRS